MGVGVWVCGCVGGCDLYIQLQQVHNSRSVRYHVRSGAQCQARNIITCEGEAGDVKERA